METEIVRLYSNACKDIYSNNSGNKFYNRLYKPLRFPIDSYECGVSKVDCLVKSEQFFGYQSLDNSFLIKQEAQVNNFIGIEEPKEYSINELIKSINTALAKVKISFVRWGDQVRIHNGNAEETFVQLAKGLNKVLSKKSLIIKGSTSEPLSTLYSAFQPRRVHVVTDFTKKQLTGDTLFPIIKTFYAEENNYQKESVQQLTYVPVIKSEISVIEIQIVGDNFKNIIVPDSNSYVELVFRPRRY
jgi:hypothetical protein